MIKRFTKNANQQGHRVSHTPDIDATPARTPTYDYAQAACTSFGVSTFA